MLHREGQPAARLAPFGGQDFELKPAHEGTVIAGKKSCGGWISLS